MTLRELPSIDRLLKTDRAHDLISRYGRPLSVEAIRESLQRTRDSVQSGGKMPSESKMLEDADGYLKDWLSTDLRPVINATGVIIHTNLGRAPLSQSAIQAISEIGQGYSSIEYDLKHGKRGSRELHCEELLRRLTGAEAAFVVNNNAAAVLLVLTALAKRKRVIISRSQLVEIGGGFRIPDVMKQSGAKLVEVGTTNRTHLRDFETAIDERTGLILQVHHSNFRITGFTAEPSLTELIELGVRYTIPVLHDLGSGALLDTADFGLGHEPTVQESVAADVPLVAFSGDKLLGGPQTGILVGKKAWIDKLRKHPLARAIRPDKISFSALVATLKHYLTDEAVTHIPIWQMIAAKPEEIKQRAQSWMMKVGQGEVIAGQSTVGGGSLPEEMLPTWLLGLDVPKPDRFAGQLRDGPIPIISRILDNRVVLDPRTVLEYQEEALIAMIREGLID